MLFLVGHFCLVAFALNCAVCASLFVVVIAVIVCLFV